MDSVLSQVLDRVRGGRLSPRERLAALRLWQRYGAPDQRTQRRAALCALFARSKEEWADLERLFEELVPHDEIESASMASGAEGEGGSAQGEPEHGGSHPGSGPARRAWALTLRWRWQLGGALVALVLVVASLVAWKKSRGAAQQESRGAAQVQTPKPPAAPAPQPQKTPAPKPQKAPALQPPPKPSLADKPPLPLPSVRSERSEAESKSAAAPPPPAQPRPRPRVPWLPLALAFVLLLFPLRLLLITTTLRRRRAQHRAARQSRILHLRRDAVRKHQQRLENGGEVHELYHIPVTLPFPRGTIEDCALYLGRVFRREHGVDLDIPATLDATLRDGGRLRPHYLPGRAARELLVLFDVERRGHPDLDGFLRLLDVWERLGVRVTRLGFQKHPEVLERPRNGPPILLRELGRAHPEAALLIFSRRRATTRRDHAWTVQLGPWPLRVWLDPDPLPPRPDKKQVIAHLRRAGLPRFPYTRAGIVGLCRYLAADGVGLRPPPFPPVPAVPLRLNNVLQHDLPLPSDVTQRALVLWAVSAALVPGPAWDQLEDLRRRLPAVLAGCPEPWFVHLLVDLLNEASNDDVEREATRLSLPTELEEALVAYAERCCPEFVDAVDTLLLQHLALPPCTIDEDPYVHARWELKRASHLARRSGGLAQVEAVCEGPLAADAEPLLRAAAQRAEVPLAERQRVLVQLGAPLPVSRKELAAAVPWLWGAAVGMALVPCGLVLLALPHLELRWRPAKPVVAVQPKKKEDVPKPEEKKDPPKPEEKKDPPKPEEKKDPPRSPVVPVRSTPVRPPPSRPRVPVVQPDMATPPAPAPPDLATPAPVDMATPAPPDMTTPSTPAPLVATGPCAECKPAMKVIAKGTFLMGSDPAPANTPEDDQPYSDEFPRHQVVITKDFELATTEVTQAQYEAVMRKNPSYSKGANKPVEQVSWFDAIDYCNALTMREGKIACYQRQGDKQDQVQWIAGCSGYRLPTEAEWEYAARAGENYKFAGSDTLEEVAWTGGSTHSVKGKKPNKWGLYDMTGNVIEWVWDRESSRYPSALQRDPRGPDGGSDRVYRGGAFFNSPRVLRVAARFRDSPGDRSRSLGFRVARSLP